MKWETVTSTIGQSVFALLNNGKQLLTLVFNPSLNSARIECEDQKRVFLIRKEGILKNKLVLTNEYGIRIGRLGMEGQAHFFELNEERFFYDMQDGDQSIMIYQASRENPLAVCAIPADESDASLSQPAKKDLADKKLHSLLMMLCWYLAPATRNQLAMAS